MIPYFSNAATALLPSSMAFLTSFSPRAFSSARVKTSGFGFGRNHQHPIHVAENNISRTHAHRSNFYRNAKVDYFVARRRVLPVGTETERGKAHIQDGLGISHVAIQHRAPAAEFPGSRAHQFSPQRVARRGTRVDIDFVALKIVERFQHQAKRFVHQLVGTTGNFFGKHVHRENRHSAADYNHILAERLNLRREKLVL